MSSLKKYRKVKYLGKGSYGAAILVELRSDPSKKFVIKEIVIGHLKPAEQQSAKNEAEVLHQMNHSNITMYVESFVESSKLYIVMEHADGGDLSAAIAKRKNDQKFYLEEEAMRIFVQICLALRHIHNGKILHRDLKSQNIFLTTNGIVKLGDFGIAKVLDASEDQARTQIGTPYYLSPEICENKPYGQKSDVWSLGVVLYEILALEMPFQATSLPALVHRICSSEPSWNQLEHRYSQTLLNLCKSLLLKNPDLRPSVNQIVRTDFIKDHISKLLSYTLKSGNGGVNDASVVQRSMLPSEAQVRQMDADEADRNMEVVRGKQHKVLTPQEVAQQRREEEREKLRKFRQDMVSKQQPLNNNNNNNRAVSPKSSRPHSPINHRANSPKGGRPLSPKPSRPNNNSPKRAASNPSSQANHNPFGRNQDQPQQQQQQPQAYESAARNEYFANRAAAQAVKAKVEAYERGGGASAAMTGQQQISHNQSSAMVVQQQQQQQQQHRRRPSESEVDINAVDPETRIAMLKAKREREKEREIAEREAQMKQAIEANREERRRMEAARQQQAPQRAPVAFDINLHDDNVVVSQPVVRRQSSERVSLDNNAVPKKKGWGPPVEGHEILQAKGISGSSRSANSSNSRPSRLSDVSVNDDDNVSVADSRSSNNNNNNNNGIAGDDVIPIDDREVLNRLESKRRSQLEVRSQAKDVLTKLREQRLKEAKQKGNQPGKVVVQHSVVSPVKRNPDAQDIAKAVDGRISPLKARLMEVMNQVELAKESVSNAVRSHSNVRVAESKEDSKTDSSDTKDSNSGKSRSNNNNNNNNSSAAELQRRAEEIREVQNLDKFTSNAANQQDGEDDLEETLKHWIEEQKRGVTVRNKRGGNPVAGHQMQAHRVQDAKADDQLVEEVVNEEDGMEMYSTANKQRSHHQAYDFDEFEVEEDLLGGDVRQETFDVNRPLKGNMEGDDVEVVGMQCMLAQALLGDDEEDEYDMDKAAHQFSHK